jgi:uncharacterized membrane protein
MTEPGVDPATVGDRWDTGRTEAFSDGVFAFAITLLVLDIEVPQTAFPHLWRGIAHEWPSYLGYATSFLTVGGIWLVHHGIFRRLQYANRPVMQLNLVLLMAIAFLPFPTSLVAEAIRSSDAERAAVIFYGGWLLVISVLIGALWGLVGRHPDLLRPEVSEKEAAAIARLTTPNLGFYAGVIVLALLAPRVAAFGYLLIAIVALLRARSGGAPPRTTTESA